MIENRPEVLSTIIKPFFATKMRDGPSVPNHVGELISASYGLEGSGYDVRLRHSVQLVAGYMSYGVTIEHFDMPTNLTGFVESKSTNFRLGINVDGKIEPGWHGCPTIEMVFTPRIDGPSSLILPAGWGIASIVFIQTTAKSSYGDDPGAKYQGDTEVQDAR